MRVVIALGGNALLRPEDEGSFGEQEKRFKDILNDLKEIQRNHEVILTHGNGPQVGNLLLQQKETEEVPGMPLDVCVSMTQGQIGYLIQKNLDNSVSVVTQVVVDSDDLDKDPSKPVGPYYEDKIEENMVRESGGWRKVVVSPEPERIVEIESIENLLENDFTVVCCGGGGVPVIDKGELIGEEAVIDKDRITSLLGRELDADLLFFYTDIDHIYRNYDQENEDPIDKLNVEEAREILPELPEGSMKPKLESAVDFVDSNDEESDRKAIIGDELDLSGDSGTLIERI